MNVLKTLLISISILITSVMIGIFMILTTSFDMPPPDETGYTAILMDRTELEKSIAYQSPKPIAEIGKIYKKDSWIFITEKYKGIHIIDNEDPALPVKTGFIRVPGCIDIAVKNNSLYADNSVDLIAIDLVSLPEIKVTERIKNVFPEPLPPDLRYMPYKYSQNSRPANTIIVEWRKIKK